MLNKDIRNLNAVLGGITFKSIGDDLFLPMIEVLGELGELSAKSESLEIESAKQLGMETVGGQVFSADNEVRLKFAKFAEEIGNKDVEISLPTLTKEQFKKLSDENEKLSAAALLLIKKHLVS